MTPSNNSHPAKLLRLEGHDRERLGEALRRLLAYGSILGLEASQSDLYHWCYQNRDWVEELCSLLELKLHWEHPERTVQAVPQTTAFLLHLRLDATLVLLTLWYEFDTAVRDRGETPPVRLTLQRLNDLLKTKFEPLRKNFPGPSRQREILSLAQRKNLLRFTILDPFENSAIEILPTLKRVIPFQGLDDWNRNAARYLVGVKDSNGPPDDDDESKEEA